MFRKFFLYLILTLGLGLTSFTTGDATGDTTPVQEHQKWVCEGAGQWGSFWWEVTRSVSKVNDKYYYYYLNVYSNSYLNKNGVALKAISYIPDVVITMTEYDSYGYEYSTYDLDLLHIICDWSSHQAAYFYSNSPTCTFTIEYSTINPYDYSKTIPY